MPNSLDKIEDSARTFGTQGRGLECVQSHCCMMA